MIKQLCGVALGALGALLALGASPGFAATASFTGATPATGNTCLYDTATIEATATDGSVTIVCKTGASLTAELLKKENASSCDYEKVNVDSNGKLSVTCSNKPTCSLKAEPSSVASGGTSILTATCSSGSGGITYTWSEISCSKTQPTCSVKPTSDTTYSVSANYSDGQTSSTETAKVTITSTAAPVCSVSQYPPNPVTTATGSVRLTAECTPEATTGYVWTGGQCLNGNTGPTCSFITPSVKTTYSVTGSNSFGKSNIVSTTVEVSSSSSDVCTLSATPSTVALGQPVTLTVGCGNLDMLHYQWSANTGCTEDKGPICQVMKPTPVGPVVYSVTVGTTINIQKVVSTTVEVTSAPILPTCTLSASPISIAVGGNSELTALCNPLLGITYLWSNTSCLNTSATCTVTPTADMSYTVTGHNAAGKGIASTPVTVKVTGGTPSYQGMWWKNDESGWGISLTQNKNNDKIFAAIYTYDDKQQQPTWYVMSDCPITAEKKNGCTGGIYKVTGGSTPLVQWVGPVTAVSEGTGTFTFNDASHGQFDYTFKDGVKRSKTIEKLAFGSGTTNVTADYTDLWWKDDENGWGVALTQEKGIIFAAWYAYDDQGNPVWYTASKCELTGTASAGNCTGDLYRVTGGSSLTQPWGSAHTVSTTDVGLVTFQFSDKDHAEMTYNIDGKSGVHKITRFGF